MINAEDFQKWLDGHIGFSMKVPFAAVIRPANDAGSKAVSKSWVGIVTAYKHEPDHPSKGSARVVGPFGPVSVNLNTVIPLFEVNTQLFLDQMYQNQAALLQDLAGIENSLTQQKKG